MTLRSMSTEWTASTSPAVARPRCLSVQSAGSVGVDQLLGGMAPLLIRPAAICLDHSLLLDAHCSGRASPVSAEVPGSGS